MDRIKQYIKDFILWLEAFVLKNKGFLAIFIIFLLFWGLQEQVQLVINKCLVPIFSIKSHVALDIFFIIAVALLLYCIRKDLINKRVLAIAERDTAILILALYLYYRMDETIYAFTRFELKELKNIAYTDVLVGGFLLYVLLLRLFAKKGDSNNRNHDFPNLDPDETLKDIRKDKFGMEEHVKSVITYLEKVNVSERAFSLGIVGSWGYGKSSFFHFIKNKINKDHRFIVMDFNPRSSKNIGYIQEDFLNGLRDVLQPYYSNLTWKFEEYARSLNVSTDVSPVLSFIYRLLKIQVKSFDENYATINSIIQSINKRIVVFVDDMDRLTAKELLEVMKVIDKNGAFKNVIFVSAYDKDYVNGALKSYLNHSVKCPYTDKYFDLEIALPKHSFHLLKSYLLDLLETATKGKLIDATKEEINEALKEASPLMEKRLRTIRDVKRFYNMFMYDYPIVQKEVVLFDYLLLELMKFSHKREYELLREFEYVTREQDTNNEILLLKTNGGLSTECEDILHHLFPIGLKGKSVNKEDRKLYIPSYFDIYFYNKEYDFHLYKEMNRLFNLPLREMCAEFDDSFKILSNSSLKIADIIKYLNEIYMREFQMRYRTKLFFQFHVFLYHKYQSEDCKRYLAQFLEEININLFFGRHVNNYDEYLSWMIEALEDFFEINPLIAAPFFNLFISENPEYWSNKLNAFTKEELKNAANRLLNDYIEKYIDSPNWSASVCYSLAKVCDGNETSYYKPAMTNLRHTMMQYPGKFLESLKPVSKKVDDGYLIGFNDEFMYKEVFHSPLDFERILLYGLDNEFSEVDIIIKFYELFKRNAFNPILVKEIKTNVTDDIGALDSKLTQMNEVCQEVETIKQKWGASKRYSNIDVDLKTLDNLNEQLNTIDINLECKHSIFKAIKKCRRKISAFKKQMDRFPDNATEGDFVRIKDDLINFYKEKGMQIRSNNVYKIDKIINDEVKLNGYYSLLPKTDLIAIPIDGIADASIYYMPAKTVYRGAAKALVVNRGYYLEHFKSCYVNDKVYYDIVKEKGFEFVHEVQHWLREEFKQELRINFSSISE